MPLLHLGQFFFAVAAGGTIGISAVLCLSFILGDGFVSSLDLLGGAWIGFSLTCAYLMVRNAPRRRVD